MRRKFAIACAALLTIQFSVATTAKDILVLGDSWGVGINNSITSVAGAAGFTVDNQAHGGREAADMVTASGLAELTSDLNANLDAKVVHLIIGGNDFLGGWSPFLSPSEEQDLFDSILNDVQTIANHINTVRPDVETFHMGYEYPQPMPPIPVPTINQAILTVSSRQESIVAPNYTYIEFYGLTQEVFGYNGNSPDGTSDPNFPGAATAFRDDIHLNQAGYDLYAQAAFDTYRAALVPEPATASFLVTSLLGAGMRRRRSPAPIDC